MLTVGLASAGQHLETQDGVCEEFCCGGLQSQSVPGHCEVGQSVCRGPVAVGPGSKDPGSVSSVIVVGLGGRLAPPAVVLISTETPFGYSPRPVDPDSAPPIQNSADRKSVV